MRVAVLLLSLVTCISGHNWYRGPYHFVIDVHRPRPFVSGQSTGQLGTFGSIAAQSANSISLAGPAGPIGPSSEGIRFGAASPSSISLGPSTQASLFDTSIQSGFAEGPSGPFGPAGPFAPSEERIRFGATSSSSISLGPSTQASLFDTSIQGFPGGPSGPFGPGRQFAESPDSISFGPSIQANSFDTSMQSGFARGPSGPFAPSSEGIRFGAASPSSISLGPSTQPISFDTSIQSGFAGEELNFADSSAVHTGFAEGFTSPSEELLQSADTFGDIGSASSFSETSNSLGPAIGESVLLGASQSTGFHYGQLPSNSGTKWFDGASKFLHYYKNQHRYGFRPHQKFSHLYYNRKSVAPY